MNFFLVSPGSVSSSIRATPMTDFWFPAAGLPSLEARLRLVLRGFMMPGSGKSHKTKLKSFLTNQKALFPKRVAVLRIQVMIHKYTLFTCAYWICFVLFQLAWICSPRAQTPRSPNWCSAMYTSCKKNIRSEYLNSQVKSVHIGLPQVYLSMFCSFKLKCLLI